MKHRKIFIVSGHSNKHSSDCGHITEDYSEGDLSVHLRKLVIQQLRNLDTIAYDVSNSMMSNIIAWFRNKLSFHKNIVLDIHFNHSLIKTTSGVETLVPKQSSEIERVLAYQLSNVTSLTLDIQKRGCHKGLEGVKIGLDNHHGRKMLLKLSGENVLLETCFMTNTVDIESYQKNKLLLAYYIAKTLYTYSLIDNESSIYTVLSGESLHRIAYQHNISIQKIKKLNNLTSDIVQIGQILKLKK